MVSIGVLVGTGSRTGGVAVAEKKILVVARPDGN